MLTVPAKMVLPFASLDRGSSAAAGGKAANLGELAGAGFPIPPGFCVTTEAYAVVAAGADLEHLLNSLETTTTGNTLRLEELAASMRERILAAGVPENVIVAIRQAYEALGNGQPLPVAVRSSATAEDLPTASFAGQQDTYLNVVGSEAVINAVRRCWASLWTARAVAYRATNDIRHRSVRLAVVVQQMVDASVAGVLFTANPLTGRRRQAVIDASPGLGEAVVSGAVNPDRFIVNTYAEQIVERKLGDKRVQINALPGGGTRRIEVDGAASQQESCLSDEQVLDLARLGARVESHYGAPQDIEWAIDAAGKLWLTQARPITTLFPLPADAPNPDVDLRVYFSFNVAQGVFRPLTPMGIQAFRLLGSGVSALWGKPPSEPAAGPTFMVEMAGRLFFDITPLMRSKTGRRAAGLFLQQGEARSAPILNELAGDPRLSLQEESRLSIFRLLAPFLARTHLPLRVLRALLFPSAARRRLSRRMAQTLALGDIATSASPAERLQAVERLLHETGKRFPLYALPLLPAGLGTFAVAGRLMGDDATPDEKQTVLRGLPYNPTTEMDLQLWAIASSIRKDPSAARALLDQPTGQLAAEYHAGTLPSGLQQALDRFLSSYGQRGVAEIDLGVPRWREDPTHILGALANYLRVDDPELAADVQFQRAVEQAEAMVAELTRRAARRNWLRGVVVGFLLRRVRELAGLREAPKFHVVTILAKARALLKEIGKELVKSNIIDATDDIFFLTLPEARAALSGTDFRTLVSQRRVTYQQELRRRRLPRVLLSDGTEPSVTPTNMSGGHVLQGVPASAGVVTARGRVILDPEGAHIAPGEILVAPSTDPGWTPLFLTAGGLVMEMGGPMSHGAVVAREYGIPAVVGVPSATERILTGQLVTIDGSAGTVALPVDAKADKECDRTRKDV